MTLQKDFKAGDLAGLSPVSEIKIPELDYQIEDLKAQIEVADDEGVKADLQQDLSELEARRGQEATEQTRDVLSKRMGELIAFVDGLDLEDLFPDLTDGEGEDEPKLSFSSEEEREKTRKEDAKNFLLGKTERGREAIKKNKALKFFHKLYESNQGTSSQEESEQDTQKAEDIRDDFVTKVNESLPEGSSLRNNKSNTKLKEFIDLLGGLPEDDLESLQEGYKAGADALTKSFVQDGKTTIESLKDLKKQTNELFSRPLSDLKGEELGQALAAAVMEANFVNNYDYGLMQGHRFVTSFRDSNGVMRNEEVEGAYTQSISNVVERFDGTEDGDSDRRTEAFAFYSEKLAQLDGKGNSKQNKQERLKYESALEGAFVAKLLNGDDDIPQGRSPVDPFFLEFAKQLKAPEAYKVISDLSKENQGMSPAEVRAHKREFLNTLSDEDFSLAMGGDSGPMGELVEFLDPQYCPDIPMNGTSAGQKVPPSECPYPIGPEAKKILRDIMSTTMMDMYSIVPQEDTGKGYGSSFSKKKEEDKAGSKFKGWLKSNKKALAKALLEKDEEMITALFASMREANLKSLNLSEYIEGYNEDSSFAGDPQKYRAVKIMELLESRKTDEKGVIAMLEKIDEEINKNYSSSSFRFAHPIRVSYAPYKPSRMTIRMRALMAKKIAKKISSHKPFIWGRIGSDPEGVSSMQRLATSYVDYQARGRQFSVGMRVYPFFGGKPDKAGVVVQSFPAIGMVDVQFPHGVSRYPVEDLVLDTSGDYENLANTPDSIPGGRGVVPVSSGASSKKVAHLYLEKMNRRG